MGKLNRNSNTNKALIELVIVILFFSISAMIIVQCFARAKIISDETQTKTRAMLTLTDMAERFDSDPVLFEEETGTVFDGDKRVISEFDKLMNPAGSEPEYFLMAEGSSRASLNGTLYSLKIFVENKNGTNIAEINTSKYISGEYV